MNGKKVLTSTENVGEGNVRLTSRGNEKKDSQCRCVLGGACFPTGETLSAACIQSGVLSDCKDAMQCAVLPDLRGR